MSEYIYDLSCDPRFDLHSFHRPTNGIAVIYHDETLCIADFSESGIVVMDLPDDLISKLRLHTARVDPYSHISSTLHVGGDAEIKQIFVFDIVDVD